MYKLDLAPLFERATREGLWFYSKYQGLWFSPAELEAEQSDGRFIWAATNWNLRDPMERLTELRDDVIRASRDIKEFAERMRIANDR